MIKSITVAFIFSLATAVSATAQVLSIDSCYALALRNYPLIKQYELIEQTKEYTLSNAGKAYLPQLSINGIEGYIFGGLPSFGPSSSGSSSDFKFIGIGQINQLIWDGGATKTQKNIVKASAQTDKASVDISMHDLRSRVNQVYFGILLIDEQLKLLATQDTVLNNNIKRITQLNENGLAYKTDVDEIRVEQLKLDQQRKEFNYTRSGYAMMLSLLTGVKVNEQTALQKPPVSNTFSDMQINRPELSLFNSQRDLVNAQGDMRRVDLMPKVGLLGAGVFLAPALSLGGAGLSTLGVAGVSASWNLGGLYRNSNEKQLTKQSLNKIDVQQETFLFNTKLQMTQTSANIEKQKAILAEDEEIVKLRQSIREGYQLKYDAGKSPLLDLLNTTEKESEARAQKALHEMQLLMSQYDYKTTTGN